MKTAVWMAILISIENALGILLAWRCGLSCNRRSTGRLEQLVCRLGSSITWSSVAVHFRRRHVRKLKLAGVLLIAAVAALGCSDEPTAPTAPTERASFATAATTTDCSTAHTLVAAETIDAGTVTVRNDDTNLFVKYSTAGGWFLEETHVHVATTFNDFPRTQFDQPKIGLFAFQQEHGRGVTDFTYSIPLQGFDFGPGKRLLIAAHAVVSTKDPRPLKETAWAGDLLFQPFDTWATYFSYPRTHDGDLVITSAEDLAFASQFGIIAGDLRIERSALANLEGLQCLRAVNGSLFIFFNGRLQNVDALSGLEKVAGSVRIISNSALINVAGLATLKSIGVDGSGRGLDINSNFALQNVDGLSALASVGGAVGIVFNPKLTSLSGLSSIRSLPSDLVIQQNEALTTLAGLANLTSVGRHLRILNASLTSLDALSALTTVGGDLNIFVGNSITTLDGLSTLTSVGGSLTLRAPAVSSLRGLSSLRALGGDLVIEQFKVLANLEGLEGLTKIGRDLIIGSNPSLRNVDGLSHVTQVGRDIDIGLNVLKNLNGLSSLTSVGGDLHIGGEPNLTDLDGLSGITSIGGNLTIISLKVLPSLNGFSGLSVVGGLNISGNDNLECSGPGFLDKSGGLITPPDG